MIPVWSLAEIAKQILDEPHKACKIVGTWKGIPWMSKGDFASEMKELQQHQWLGGHLNHWLTWCSWKNMFYLYRKYAAMSICHDVGCTWFYCFQNDQHYPERTTKGVKNCEENLQWNVEFESRLWWILTPNLLGLVGHPTSCCILSWKLTWKLQLPAVSFRDLPKIPLFFEKIMWKTTYFMRSCVRSTDTSPNNTSWRFQPIWTIILKLDHVSRDQNKNIFETTNQIIRQNHIPLFVAHTPHWLGHLGLQILSYQATKSSNGGHLQDHIGPCSSPLMQPFPLLGGSKAEIPTQNQGPHLGSRESYRYVFIHYINILKNLPKKNMASRFLT